MTVNRELSDIQKDYYEYLEKRRKRKDEFRRPNYWNKQHLNCNTDVI